MGFRDNYDFGIIVNEAERLVLEELERRFEELDDSSICICQDCILDMATLALNSVKPFYRVSLLGTMYAQAVNEGAYAEEIKKAVESAIEKVTANPAHD